MRWLASTILRIFGWTYIGHEKLIHFKQYVLIVAPHTSNWDFPLGILLRKSAGLDYVKFIGKASLFRPPLGWIFRALGGYPVERSQNKNQVEAMVDLFKKNDHFAIVMAPEGTRKKVDKFKSGFYYIAKGANVPIIPCIFDFAKKECRYLDPIYCGTNSEEDITKIENIFKGVQGKNPEYNFE